MGKIRLLLTALILFLSADPNVYAQGKLQFFQTDWGNQLPWDTFCENTAAAGYHGVEAWLPNDKKNREAFKRALDKHGLTLGILNGTNKSIPFKESLEQFVKGIETALSWKPAYINCHTGSDFFTLEENKAFIAAANALGKKYNTPIYHETHRGRFSYNLPDTEKYLDLIPGLQLTLDISHWMVVHESLLQGQDNRLNAIIENSGHIHARVGHAEGPQVNDPQAPEWQKALDRHLDIWEKVIRKGWKENNGVFTITTEFGPAGYMPTLPYTQIPVTDQWKANVFIMNAIKERMNTEQTP